MGGRRAPGGLAYPAGVASGRDMSLHWVSRQVHVTRERRAWPDEALTNVASWTGETWDCRSGGRMGGGDTIAVGTGWAACRIQGVAKTTRSLVALFELTHGR